MAKTWLKLDLEGLATKPLHFLNVENPEYRTERALHYIFSTRAGFSVHLFFSVWTFLDKVVQASSRLEYCLSWLICHRGPS